MLVKPIFNVNCWLFLQDKLVDSLFTSKYIYQFISFNQMQIQTEFQGAQYSNIYIYKKFESIFQLF